jgi:hypothetical protein
MDRQNLATFVAGVLLLLISFTTNYRYGDLQHFGSLAINEQVGMGLHLAALAALFSDVELATRFQHRAGDQETARRQQEARFRIALIRFQLADTSKSRLQLNAALAVLLEGLVSGS